MSAEQHPFDRDADEIARHVEETARYIARNLIEGRAGPFTKAGLSDKKMLGYYREKFTRPDGGMLTPDEAYAVPEGDGTTTVGQRIGKRGVADVYAELMKTQPAGEV